MRFTKEEIENGLSAKEILDKKLFPRYKTVHQVYHLMEMGVLKGFDTNPNPQPGSRRRIKFPKKEVMRVRKLICDKINRNLNHKEESNNEREVKKGCSKN